MALIWMSVTDHQRTLKNKNYGLQSFAELKIIRDVCKTAEFRKKKCQARLVMTLWIMRFKSSLDKCQCDSFWNSPSCKSIIMMANNVILSLLKHVSCYCIWTVSLPIGASFNASSVQSISSMAHQFCQARAYPVVLQSCINFIMLRLHHSVSIIILFS